MYNLTCFAEQQASEHEIIWFVSSPYVVW
jgi:hypothetical protein